MTDRDRVIAEMILIGELNSRTTPEMIRTPLQLSEFIQTNRRAKAGAVCVLLDYMLTVIGHDGWSI